MYILGCTNFCKIKRYHYHLLVSQSLFRKAFTVSVRISANKSTIYFTTENQQRSNFSNVSYTEFIKNVHFKTNTLKNWLKMFYHVVERLSQVNEILHLKNIIPKNVWFSYQNNFQTEEELHTVLNNVSVP